MLTPLLHSYEKKFKKKINTSGFLCPHDETRFTRFDNVLYKHTLELIYDNYEHLIPDKYICQQNRILYMYSEIYQLMGKRGNLTFIKKLLQIKHMPNKHYNLRKIIYGAVETNNLHICDWLIENSYEYDPVAVARTLSAKQQVGKDCSAREKNAQHSFPAAAKKV